MRLLLIAPQYNANMPGESWSTYKWVQGISARCETTILTQHKRGWAMDRSPTNAKLIVNWEDPKLPGLRGRMMWEMKPGYIFYYWRARKWIKTALRNGQSFDLVHQINPLALRYPSPARGLGIPYIIGPLAGSLSTPEALRATTPEGQWYRKLRSLDSFRLRHDPWLRDTYSGAVAVIGVAPYVRDLLAPCNPQRFELMAETGVEEISTIPKTPPAQGAPLRLLFVGRLISTKGILEAIESVARARATCSLTLDIVGTGDLAGECDKRIAQLGVGDIVRLHGRQPKEEVFRWYDRSHVFLFPSYREPSGNVVFEAMSRGLPVITSTVGGPGHVVTDACGFRIPPQDRAQYISGLASAIATLAREPDRLPALSAGALQRITETALWPAKIDWMMNLYRDILDRSAS